MFKHNFKKESFQGTLLELLEVCNPHLKTHRNAWLDASDWIENRVDTKEEILPIRKHQNLNKRGDIKEEKGREFIAVDNELLAALISIWISGKFAEIKNQTIKEGVEKEILSLSWKLDVPYKHKPDLKGAPVSTKFRDNGLKIAHIMDAGDAEECTLTERFLRTLHPLNVFLFPSHKIVSFELVKGSFSQQRKDWAEDPFIREIASCFILKQLMISSDTKENFNKIINGKMGPNNWHEIAKEVNIKVTPKKKKFEQHRACSSRQPRKELPAKSAK